MCGPHGFDSPAPRSETYWPPTPDYLEMSPWGPNAVPWPAKAVVSPQPAPQPCGPQAGASMHDQQPESKGARRAGCRTAAEASQLEPAPAPLPLPSSRAIYRSGVETAPPARAIYRSGVETAPPARAIYRFGSETAPPSRANTSKSTNETDQESVVGPKMIRVGMRRVAEGLWAGEKPAGPLAGLVCIELRRCQGQPLEPCADACPWQEPAQAKHLFTLGAWLRKVLGAVGGPAIDVLEHAGGQPLVPYQAFVPFDQWRCLWEGLEEPLESLREAYRVKRRGVLPPEFRFGVVPRFTQHRLTC